MPKQFHLDTRRLEAIGKPRAFKLLTPVQSEEWRDGYSAGQANAGPVEWEWIALAFSIGLAVGGLAVVRFAGL